MSGGRRVAQAAKTVTVHTIAERKAESRPIVMVTAYDHPSAVLIEEAGGIDLVLVGDSAANVVLGYDSTVPVTVEEMLMLTRAVRRGLRTPMLVADLPFGSYEASDTDAVHSAQRFVKEAGADAVKLERAGTTVDRVRAIVRAGIPVVGHVGLTPQSATSLGGFRVQGRSAADAERLLNDALALQEAGCFAIVFEAVPAAVADLLMPHLACAVIGIGAGAGTDGQVLVWHDLLGLHGGRVAKFVHQFADLRPAMLAGIRAYAEAVQTREFPAAKHTYAVPEAELDELRARLSNG